METNSLHSSKVAGGTMVRHGSWQRLVRCASHALGLILMIGALYIVQKQFRGLKLSDIKNALVAIPPQTLMLSVGCTFVSYFILSFYDRLAALQLGCRLSFWRTAFAAFCSYVLSHNIGFSAISGAAVRFRLYGNWGVKPFIIAQIIAFCSTTYLLGALALVGAVFLFEPQEVPLLGTHFSFWLLRVGGVLAWVIVVAYIALSVKMKEVRLGRYTIALPGFGLAIAQVVVSTADVAATAAIAYALLPSSVHLGYGAFLAIYIASYTAGLVASVPGGLGVFDGTMIMALSAYMPTAQILSVILVFRLFYYIIPLFMAGAMFAGHELFLRGEAAIIGDFPPEKRPLKKKIFRGIGSSIRESEAEFSVAVATACSSLCGIGLLGLSFLTVPHWRMVEWYSWPVFMIVEYGLCICAIGFMGVSIGLARRVVLAWYMELCLLSVSIVLGWLRGINIYILFFMALVMFLIVPFRAVYYRHSRLFSSQERGRTILSLVLLGIFVFILWWWGPAHLHMESWRDVLLSSSASLSTSGAMVVALLVGLVMIYSVVAPGTIVSTPWDRQMASYYHSFPVTCSDLAGGIHPDGVITSKKSTTALPFIRDEGFIIGLGDPVGHDEEIIEVIRRLRDLAEQEKHILAFWNVRSDWLPIYQDMHLRIHSLETILGCEDRYACCQDEEVFLLGILLKKRHDQTSGVLQK